MRSRLSNSLPPLKPTEIWAEMKTNTGETVFDLQKSNPVLLVFLRHFGCSFCREAMGDLAKRRRKLEKDGSRIVFVHMGSNEMAETFFKKYGLLPVHHVSDPATFFYKEFGLVKATVRQTISFMNWIRGFEASIIEGHGAANPTEKSGLGDGFQMPGVFMLFQGEIREQFIHRTPYDRPDYEKIAACCSI